MVATSMSKSPFNHSQRRLLCGGCKRAIGVPVAGGAVTCNHCDTEIEIGPRPEPSLVPADRHPTPITERLAALRAQDGAPLRPPGTLPLSLMGWHGEADDKKRDAALEAWQAARLGLGSGSPGDNDEAHLYFLTLALNNYYGVTRDLERRRALLESAVELCTTARHRQVLYCELARAAARADDLDAAEAWLAPCDPEPDDLYMDSAYRFTRAFLASRAEDWSAVLDQLGRELDEIPVADFMDHLCALYRAHALEMSGDADSAIATLEAAMRRLRGTPRSFMEVAEAADIHLCPTALPAAYEPAMRRWKLRHAVFLTVWIALLNYVALDWLTDLGPLSPGIHSWWPLPIVFVLGWILNVRWKP